MGLFGIKTRKEKQAEAEKANTAKVESELLESIDYWPHEKCYDELKAYENGQRSNYSRRVIEKIRNRKQKLAREIGDHNKRRDLDKKIAAKEAEIKRLKERDPWTYSVGGGMYMKFRSTENDKRMAEEVQLAERELARLKMQRDNIGKEY